MHGETMKFGILVSIEEDIHTAVNKLRYCTYTTTKNRITPSPPYNVQCKKTDCNTF